MGRSPPPAPAPGGCRDAGAQDSPTGRAEGLERLYVDHYASTVRMAGLMVGDYQLGEEIAQDAFARLFESFETVRNPSAYLHGTVVNLCRSRVRRVVMARRVTSANCERPVEAGADFSDALADRSAVQHALRRLPRRQGEAVVLRFYGQLPHAAVAEAMGVSVGSVKSHLSRAMASLATLSKELQ